MTSTDARTHQDIWGVAGAEADMSLTAAVRASDIEAAAARIKGHAIRTPVFSRDQLDAHFGAQVFLKMESFQRIGAFKFRGAFNAISKLSEEQKARGVVTFSSGNHAQGIALAASLQGVRAVIVMPENAPKVKLDATEGYLATGPAGSKVVRYDPDEVIRERLGREIAEKEGLTLIPPYDHPDVIAGQGTAGLELIEHMQEAVGGVDVLYVCCGGGGLLSGCATICKDREPGAEVYGVEPALGDDAARSFESRRLVVNRNPPTIADGARTAYVGRYTFPIILERVDGFVTVSEGEIAAGVRYAAERLKAVIEPSGALGLAGLAQHASRGRVAKGSRIGVIVSGGNIDPAAIGSVMELAAESGGFPGLA